MGADDNPYALDAISDRQSAQVIQIDSGKHVSVVALCAALCGISVPIAVWSGYRASQAEQEARMLEYYVNEVDGKLIHAGFIEPRDRWSPEKRKQYQGSKP